MSPLTESVPKPLVVVDGRPILEHLICALPEEVDNLVLVVGYKQEMIREFLGDKYMGKAVTYVEQPELNGTAGAVLRTQHLFSDPKERFMIIYGDEIPTVGEVAECLQHEYSWLCHEISSVILTGVADIDAEGCIRGVVENRDGKEPPYVSAGGLMVVNASLFKYKPQKHKTGEYYVTSMLDQFLQENKMKAVIGRKDLYFTSEEDVVKYEEKL